MSSQVYRIHHLKEGPPKSCELTSVDALEMYKQMHVIRKMETLASKLYQSKIIRGFCHLYSGQEAVCVGIWMAKREFDTLISSYRSHSWCYLASKDPSEVIGELLGVECGCNRGKGGSMHMLGKSFFGGQGIVGAQVPLGVGIALAHRYRKTKGVNFICYGDGAANQGQVFEAFNLAQLHKLPAVFVCENNHYGMGTGVKRSSANIEYYKRGDYIPGMRINGMDVLAMREAAKFAINYVLENGPLILEAITYRYFGHSLSDPGTSYRSREEIQRVRTSMDPIQLFKQVLIDSKVVTKEELKGVEKESTKEVERHFKESLKCKELGLKGLFDDVYSKPLEERCRGTLEAHRHTNSLSGGFPDFPEMMMPPRTENLEKSFNKLGLGVHIKP